MTATPNSQPSDQAAGPGHTETETHGWTIDVPDHPTRQDSPEYVAARRQMNEIASQATGLIYGPGPFQDHHGGALWLKDAQGWFMIRNLAEAGRRAGRPPADPRRGAPTGRAGLPEPINRPVRGSSPGLPPMIN